jgi:hypothetical protein
MKLLIKMMAVFVTIYAVGSMFRSVRIAWPFAFISTALISLLGGAADRIVLPKLSRTTAVITDILFMALTLFGAGRLMGGRGGKTNTDQQMTLPYISTVSAVLGGIESIYHEWLYKRDRYEHPEGGSYS